MKEGCKAKTNKKRGEAETNTKQNPRRYKTLNPKP